MWKWQMSDLEHVTKNKLNVFSCFSCGGGSTMGYKLAGYNVIGNVEIDPKMMEMYVKNHNPKYPYLMSVQEFKLLPEKELPKELFDLDILDGSPPCSVFSIAGKRDEKWGEKYHFREGQAKQRLDNLFFDFIDVVEKLQPKVVVAENVKGMVIGKAKGFVSLIIKAFKDTGYDVQLFQLNSATMGVPQKRERVFFIAKRKDLDYPKLKLMFNEDPILYKDVRTGKGKPINPNTSTYKRWAQRRPSDMNLGDITKRNEGKQTNFNTVILQNQRVPNTIASGSVFLRYDVAEHITKEDIINIQTFPQDYDFLSNDVQYVCGMSVPPVMMKKIAEQIYLQWFKA